MSICSVIGCDEPVKARGCCMSHYSKALARGDFVPRSIARRGSGLHDRLRSIGWTVTASGCWDWNGATLNGYGRVGRSPSADHDVLAHRVSYGVHKGAIPEGMFVHHKCANRRCINPDHLELTTSRDNMGEMMERNFYITRIKELEAEIAHLGSRFEAPAATFSPGDVAPIRGSRRGSADADDLTDSSSVRAKGSGRA